MRSIILEMSLAIATKTKSSGFKGFSTELWTICYAPEGAPNIPFATWSRKGVKGLTPVSTYA